MADKQLIIVVEGTAAMAPHWTTIVSNYLDNIIRSFCTDDMIFEKSSPPVASGSTFELALVMFNAHGPYSAAFLIKRSGWTRDVNEFFGWLSTLSFSGGESNDVATTEGLAEALMMFAIPQNGYQAQQNLDGKRHCILVSASNPYPLPRSVYRPAIEIMEQPVINEAQTENLLYDAETVSTWFGQCSVSLSVICPKQLPKLKAIYNAANPNRRISEPAVDIKLPHFLVLISDGFIEARAALSRSYLSQTNGSPLNGPGNVAQATVKVEPDIVSSIGPGHANPLTFTLGMPQQAQVMQSIGMNNSTSKMPVSEQGSQSKYIKIWEGCLFGKRQGQPVFISRLEGYRNDNASEMLAANWPSTMHIIRLISQDHMYNNQYSGKADFLVFRAMNPHGFLFQLQEKKLCAVIELPSQTLLLCVSDKTSRLFAMLFPGDMVVFKQQIPTQHQQEQQPQLQQWQQQQQQLQPLQQYHHPQLQQHQFQQLQQHQLQQMQQHQFQQMQQQQQMMQQQLHFLQQQMMQYQLQHQPSMQLEISQPQQIVGDGTGHSYMAENGFVVKSEPL